MKKINIFSVAIDNWTRFPLVEPATEITCGQAMEEMPEQISPGSSEMALIEKGVNKSLIVQPKEELFRQLSDPGPAGSKCQFLNFPPRRHAC
jgi:hypothetical protein